MYSKPYSLPHAMQAEVEKQLETMLKLGTIEPSNSAYASLIVVVRGCSKTRWVKPSLC